MVKATEVLLQRIIIFSTDVSSNSQKIQSTNQIENRTRGWFNFFISVISFIVEIRLQIVTHFLMIRMIITS
jgi:hypothetical protein